jgi:hypothetical protein
VRIENLQNEARSGRRYGKTLCAMLCPFLRKEVAKKEASENFMAGVIFIMS